MPDRPPFFKWDPDGANARRREAARHIAAGVPPEEADRRAAIVRPPADRLAGKRWLLRWAWLVSTGMLVFGYLILVILLTGLGDWFHLT